MKVAYRGKYNFVKLADIRIGDQIDGQLEFAFFQNEEKKWVKPNNLEEIEEHFKFGKQIRISFFSIVSREFDPQWNDKKITEPKESGTEEFCSNFTYLCKAAELTYQLQDKYLKVVNDKNIPGNIDILAIGLSTKELYE